jgi:hypothetical protein
MDCTMELYFTLPTACLPCSASYQFVIVFTCKVRCDAEYHVTPNRQLPKPKATPTRPPFDPFRVDPAKPALTYILGATRPTTAPE